MPLRPFIIPIKKPWFTSYELPPNTYIFNPTKKSQVDYDLSVFAWITFEAASGGPNAPIGSIASIGIIYADDEGLVEASFQLISNQNQNDYIGFTKGNSQPAQIEWGPNITPLFDIEFQNGVVGGVAASGPGGSGNVGYLSVNCPPSPTAPDLDGTAWAFYGEWSLNTTIAAVSWGLHIFDKV